jgi:hypothetical protein
MCDWEDHTQKVYKKREKPANLVSDESEVTQWDTRPDIIAEVSTSEAATADPEDTDSSAFVFRFIQLDTRSTRAARKAKASKSKHKSRRAQGSLPQAGGPHEGVRGIRGV